MKHWRALGIAIREVVTNGPSLVAEAVDRWLLRQHGPHDTAGDGSGPAVCLLCKAAWPCDEFIATDRRIDQRIERDANRDMHLTQSD